VQRDDVRVIEAGDDACFALEASQALRRRDLLGEYFERDVAPESFVVRTKDLTHAAGAECAEDLVAAEAGAGGEWHAANVQRASPDCWSANDADYSVLRKAMSAFLSWSESERPNSCPCTARFFTP